RVPALWKQFAPATEKAKTESHFWDGSQTKKIIMVSTAVLGSLGGLVTASQAYFGSETLILIFNNAASNPTNMQLPVILVGTYSALSELIVHYAFVVKSSLNNTAFLYQTILD